MDALGIDIRALIFQLTNFVLLCIVLYTLLHKPLRTLMVAREKEIADGIANAEHAKLELAAAAAKGKELIAAADEERQELLAAARAAADALEAKLLAEAKEQMAIHLEQHRQNLFAEREQMKAELRQELAGMVITATEKVLRSDLPAQARKEQIHNLVKEI